MQHRITIHASGRDLYRVSGAVDIFDTGAPIPDAARALIAASASPSDTLHATGDFTFSPVTLGAILKPRRPPKQSDIRQMLGMARN